MSGAKFEHVDGWEQLPRGYTHLDVAGVAVDAADRVYVLTRQQSRVIVYERDGRFVRSWGEGLFSDRPHGITVAPDGTVFCVDDSDHTIRRFTAEGAPLHTLGSSGKPSDTGYDGKTITSVRRGGPPFNRPTNLAIAPNGDLYVTDGYGNSRVHHFSPDGRLIRSWGEPGNGPGEFHTPHGICVLPDHRVVVADRENDRIQVFSADGAFLEQWTDIQRPTQICPWRDGLLYVSELWWRKGDHSFRTGDVGEDRFGRVSIIDDHGRMVARFGGGPPGTPGNFTAPHDIAIDSRGDLYVAEVTHHFAVSRGLVRADAPTLQKLARR